MVKSKKVLRKWYDSKCDSPWDEIGPVILGDPAHPLLNWLMKAYPENEITPRWQRHFNY